MCNALFPNLSPLPSEILYVVGNGFDIAHDIRSQYGDFKRWVMERGNQQLIRMMDIFFSNEHDLWSDIETALGEYREDEILDFCKPTEGIDYDHPMRSIAAIEDGSDWIFKPILDEFLKSFTAWVNSIVILHAKQLPQIYQLEEQSKYLTFNYTETLEEVYNIPNNNVLHIHGSRTEAKNDYIMGHNNTKPTDLHDTLNGEFYFEQNTKNKIIGWMNQLYKDTSSIIRHNEQFFHSLKEITHVSVIGHSLNKVDWPYFDAIKKNVQMNTTWIFNPYSSEDKKRIEAYIDYSGIKQYKI